MARQARTQKHGRNDRKDAPRTAYRPVRSFLCFFVTGLVAAAIVAHNLDAGQRAPRRAPEASAPHAASRPRNPDAADQRFEEGRARFREENLEEAFRAFSAAAELDPQDPRPHVGLAKVLEMLNYRERAEDAYRRAIAINPGYYEAKIELARVLCDFGKHEESNTWLRSALADDPENHRAVAELAVNELRRGNPAAAIPLLERYLASTAPTAWTYENLGRAHADAGNAKAAEEHYRRALALNPNTELANLWLGQLLVATGRRAEADTYFRRYRELHGYQVEAREVEQAIARRPGDAGKLVALLVRLAELRARQGKHEESLVPLKRALDVRPDDAGLRRIYEAQAQRAAAAAPR